VAKKEGRKQLQQPSDHRKKVAASDGGKKGKDRARGLHLQRKKKIEIGESEPLKR